MRCFPSLLALFFLGIAPSVCGQDLIVLVSKDTIYAKEIEVTRSYINYYEFYEEARELYSFKRENIEQIKYVDGRVGTPANNFFASMLDYPKSVRLEHTKTGELILFRVGDFISYQRIGEKKRKRGEIVGINASSIFIDTLEMPFNELSRVGMYVPAPAFRKIAGVTLIAVGAVTSGIGAMSTIIGMGSLKENDGPIYLGGGLAAGFLGIWGVSKGVGLIIRAGMVDLEKTKWELITDV